MQYSFLNVFVRPDDCDWSEHEKAGRALLMLAEVGNGEATSVATLRRHLIEPIRQENIEFFYDSNERMVGYATWAFLDPATESKILAQKRIALARSEWNSGQSAWLIEVVAPFGNLRYLLKHLARGRLREVQVVRFLRDRGGKVTIKEMVRSSYSSWFRL